MTTVNEIMGRLMFGPARQFVRERGYDLNRLPEHQRREWLTLIDRIGAENFDRGYRAISPTGKERLYREHLLAEAANLIRRNWRERRANPRVRKLTDWEASVQTAETASAIRARESITTESLAKWIDIRLPARLAAMDAQPVPDLTALSLAATDPRYLPVAPERPVLTMRRLAEENGFDATAKRLQVAAYIHRHGCLPSPKHPWPWTQAPFIDRFHSPDSARK